MIVVKDLASVVKVLIQQKLATYWWPRAGIHQRSCHPNWGLMSYATA